MRRLLFFAVLVPAACWLLWASCQSDDYRDTLPLRSFDAAPREGGAPSPPDLVAPADLARPDQGPADLQPSDGGPTDGSPTDSGPADGAPSDGGGPGDAGVSDGAASD